MESIKELYKVGRGPSSSHTMGPEKAALIFKEKNPNAEKYKVTLYGSLAATGKGHFTDKIICEVLGEEKTKIVFNTEVEYKYHPNGMKFAAYVNNSKVDEWVVFSVGGGSLKNLGEPRDVSTSDIYKLSTLNDIIDYCKKENKSFVDYVKENEGIDILNYLKMILDKMFTCVNNGLFKSGILEGGLNVERKAASFYNKYLSDPTYEKLVYAASLAAAEENASCGMVVTAPTCGSCGVVPAILFAEKVINKRSEEQLINALMVAGLIGNIVKTNGSISGAEVGCQGEIGVACSMASSIVAYLKGATINEIEYAAEIALEHHLGMTCDPVNGLVQIPCIERNAIAAMTAYNCANYAILTSGVHHISFDNVIRVMKETGSDLQEKYRETAIGGLAAKKEL